MRNRAADRPRRERLPQAAQAVRAVGAAGLFPLASSQERGWKGVAVNHYRIFWEEVHQPPLADHLITISRSALRLEQRLDGRTEATAKVPGDVGVVPAAVECHYSFSDPFEVLHLGVRPEFLHQVALETDGLRPDRVELLNCLQRRDPVVEQVGVWLMAELTETGGIGGRLYAESLANVLAVRLLRHYCAAPQAVRHDAGGLSRERLRRAVKYINDHLDRDLSLAEIARAVHLSEHHFARMFKHSTGLAPHQYLIQRRVERAKELLSSGDLSVAAVAAAVGFADQSHLTRHFRRVVGVTPGRFRSG